MKNLQLIVIEAHELGVLNSDLLLFFNNFSFSDNNHYETNIEANIVFPSILRIEGFNNNYCYCFKSYYDDINYLFINYSCIDKQGNPIDQKRYDSLIDAYIDGFKSGYNNFLNSIKERQIFIGNHEEQADLIFKRVLRPYLQKRGRFKHEEQFFDIQNPDFHSEKVSNSEFQPPSFQIEKIVFDEKEFYESGKGGGEYFKAWEIIFENQNIFIELFYSAGIIICQSNLEHKNNSIYQVNDNLSFDDKLEFTENTNDSTELSIKHPFYNNNFNLKCFKLFMYINEKYDKKKKVRYKYIFFFLKEHSDKEVYKFRFTQDQYRNYILKYFKEDIKNMNKDNYIFSKEMSHLTDLEIEFKDL
jgi:hypothetical protein